MTSQKEGPPCQVTKPEMAESYGFHPMALSYIPEGSYSKK